MNRRATSPPQGSPMDHKKFKDIFMEAVIIDFDLSHWDRRLRLIAVATEETDLAKDGMLPIYVVDFNRMSSIKFDVLHLSEEFEGRYQWNATLESITHDEDRYIIDLSSEPKLAALQIVCEDVTITPIEKNLIDMVCPGWGKPDSALVRPGILEMAKRMDLI
jgi:hypothetical protein